MSYALSSFDFFRRTYDFSVRLRLSAMLGAVLLLTPFVVVTLSSAEINAAVRQLNGFFSSNDIGETDAAEPTESVSRKLAPHLTAAVEAIAKRYRVAQPAVEDVVILAESAAKSAKLDPLLVLAVIGVESRFNPYAASPFGAQGLMQVIGKFHTDKYKPTPDGLALLDPETNINVGTRILREYLNNTGDLNAALKRYGGETDDSGIGYAEKVIAERERLQQLVQRAAKT